MVRAIYRVSLALIGLQSRLPDHTLVSRFSFRLRYLNTLSPALIERLVRACWVHSHGQFFVSFTLQRLMERVLDVCIVLAGYSALRAKSYFTVNCSALRASRSELTESKTSITSSIINFCEEPKFESSATR